MRDGGGDGLSALRAEGVFGWDGYVLGLARERRKGGGSEERWDRVGGGHYRFSL
jgi:hypothetical protein